VAKTACLHKFRPVDADGARLLKVLGPRHLAALQDALGGKRVWIPKPGVAIRCLVCNHRDRCIRKMRREGQPVEQIARRFGISPKTVYRVLRVKVAS
jgi:Mor family transcriptional regulator